MRGDLYILNVEEQIFFNLLNNKFNMYMPRTKIFLPTITEYIYRQLKIVDKTSLVDNRNKI